MNTVYISMSVFFKFLVIFCMWLSGNSLLILFLDYSICFNVIIINEIIFLIFSLVCCVHNGTYLLYHPIFISDPHLFKGVYKGFFLCFPIIPPTIHIILLYFKSHFRFLSSYIALRLPKLCRRVIVGISNFKYPF